MTTQQQPNDQQANEPVEEVIDLTGITPTRDELLAQATQLMADKDYEAARAIFKRIIDDDPNDIEAMFGMAAAAPDKDAHQATLFAILDIDSDNEDAVASLMQSAHDDDERRALLQEIIRRQPNNTMAHSVLNMLDTNPAPRPTDPTRPNENPDPSAQPEQLTPINEGGPNSTNNRWSLPTINWPNIRVSNGLRSLIVVLVVIALLYTGWNAIAPGLTYQVKAQWTSWFGPGADGILYPTSMPALPTPSPIPNAPTTVAAAPTSAPAAPTNMPSAPTNTPTPTTAHATATPTRSPTPTTAPAATSSPVGAYPAPAAIAPAAPTTAPAAPAAIVPGTTSDSVSGTGTIDDPFVQQITATIPTTSSIDLQNGDGLRIKLLSGNGDVLLTWRNASGTKTGDLLIPINQLAELSAIAAEVGQSVEIKLVPASGMDLKVEIYRVLASAMPNTAGDCESWPCE